MKTVPFTGTGVAIVTPFQPNGDIDFEALGKLIHFLTEGGVDYLVVLGTTGESATLDAAEKQSIFSYVAEANAGRLPLMAGIGGNDTRSVLKQLRGFDLKGYAAILSVSPYYNKPSQEGIFQHYKAIGEQSPLPVMMYNVPGRTGMNVTAETTLRIAAECNAIFAIKEASGNMDQIMQLIKWAPGHFSVISGDDALTLPMIALGARGVISVVANAFPDLFSNMVRHCLAGDFASARPPHESLLEVISTLFEEGSPSGIKAYLSKLGICSQAVRLPVVPVSSKMMARIDTLLSKPGLTKLTLSDNR